MASIISRRALLGPLGAALLFLAPAEVMAAKKKKKKPKPKPKPPAQSGAPYPASRFITGLSFEWANFRHHAEGSDNFPLTWAADGNLYTSWGDGGGFGPNAVDLAYVSLGIARLTGSSATAIQGTNLIGGLDPEVAQCMQLIPPDRAERYPGRVCTGIGRHGK